MPAMWYGGTLTRTPSLSSAAPNSTEPRMYETRCLWRSTAAFGAPVVPLVKSRIEISSGSMPQPESSALPPLEPERNSSRVFTSAAWSRSPSARSASVTR